MNSANVPVTRACFPGPPLEIRQRASRIAFLIGHSDVPEYLGLISRCGEAPRGTSFIHDNPAWLEPVGPGAHPRPCRGATVFSIRACSPVRRPPPEGRFLQRMSASSQTRDHRDAPN